ncbi:hypothetical protein Mgra_00001471 [Meloidogyne graminicola]|uniref:Uncharacterized protein n=1 Tax=Meloidogyne graminicola TaxID=189291 RepID=A0A8S9ZZ81_9BILA|nr:hypothetical protein Mgra_00001471 [Meloidogyne graminicola]
MGNESTKSDNTASSSASQRIQKVIPNAIKSVSNSSTSTSLIQRTIDQAKKSKTLNLKGAGMKIMSPLIDELSNELRTIDLTSNKLKLLSPSIGNFIMLRQLYISENKLTELPDELGCLKKLEVLNASGNQLEKLPDSLVGCLALSNICLSNNRFREFPIVLTHLIKLELLDLSGNTITRLPNQICDLRAIELNLQRNRLVSLNASNLEKCERLKTLRVDENCLSKESFTKELLENSQLSLITFDGNLFQERDFQAIKGYESYEQRFTATKKRLF